MFAALGPSGAPFSPQLGNLPDGGRPSFALARRSALTRLAPHPRGAAASGGRVDVAPVARAPARWIADRGGAAARGARRDPPVDRIELLAAAAGSRRRRPRNRGGHGP